MSAPILRHKFERTEIRFECEAKQDEQNEIVFSFSVVSLHFLVSEGDKRCDRRAQYDVLAE